MWGQMCHVLWLLAKTSISYLLEPSVLEDTLRTWSKCIPSSENQIAPSIYYNFRNTVNPMGHVCVFLGSKADHWIKRGCKSVMFFFLNVARALLCNFVSEYLGTKKRCIKLWGSHRVSTENQHENDPIVKKYWKAWIYWILTCIYRTETPRETRKLGDWNNRTKENKNYSKHKEVFLSRNRKFWSWNTWTRQMHCVCQRIASK